MRTVITYGTFDLFHKGHYNILKRAKEEGDYLIVGVTGESYDSERGKLSVQDSLATRIENVKKTGFADKIIVEEYLGQKIPDIIKYNVDVLVIGSDWRGKFDHLKKYCEVKYLERTKDISSTQIRQQSLKMFKFGIVTDDLYDNDAVMEPKNVSGVHVESVFCEDLSIAKQFSEKYELDKGYDNYDEFLSGIDIIYIKSSRKNRQKYVEKAIESGVHVICDAPYTIDIEEDKRLADLAKEKQVLLINNITTLYLQAFGQLMWMARGNLIGDLVSVKCSISRKAIGDDRNLDVLDLAYYPLCVIIKCLGSNINSYTCKVVKDSKGNVVCTTMNLLYDNSVAFAEVLLGLDSPEGITIVGTDGTIIVPEDWCKIGYFKLRKKGDLHFKRYTTNFEGNGFRYLIQAMLAMIRAEGSFTYRIDENESTTILKVLNELKKECER